MKLKSLIALAALAAVATTPAFSAEFTLDFEGVSGFTSISEYYNGGVDGAGNSGTNFGASFTGGALGLVNDDLGPYFENAPSPLGVMFAADPDAFLNVDAGVAGALFFSYSSSDAVAGGLKAYSGLNGSGSLLGTFDLAATNANCLATAYCQWSAATLSFSGLAKSFDFGGSVGFAAFDNLVAVPEPSTYALMLGSLGVLALVARRRRG